ncbi:peptide/nickel transport system permease protein [Agromyces sp. CF514]|uniref:ABC transporter permease n=1 Tax=Agromyces sp. CF514 TaxID=1881031 RepID=UPI0008F42CEA|nr:peptide/nickel transport system permease protein [Agromyces sp. CF514]
MALDSSTVAVVAREATTAGPRGGGRFSAAALRGVAGKLGGLLLTLFLASLLVFFSRFLVPGDPVRFLLRGRKPSAEAIAQVTAQYGLDLPPWQQYLNWVAGALHGDFGRSLQYRQDVSTVIGERLPVTLLLVVMAGILIAVIGLSAGIVAALNKGRVLDRVTLIGLTVLSAIPSFVGSILLISVFAVQLGWFPTFGSGEGLGDMVYHLVLPSIALAIVFVVLVGKVTRSSMVDQLGREHVEVATSRGLRRGTVIRRHVFRNALGPILTVSGVLVAGLLVASTIVEAAFGLSGIGSLLVASVDRLDFPVVQAIVMLVVTAFVVVNAIIDILEPVIDPRSAAGAAAR